jgi:diacylglycerol kinase family enzyme
VGSIPPAGTSFFLTAILSPCAGLSFLDMCARTELPALPRDISVQVFVNRAAGRHRAASYLPRLQTLFESRGFIVQFVETSGAVLLEDLSALSVLRLLPRLMGSGKLRTARVKRWKVKRVRMCADRPSLFHGDGEILGPAPVEIEVVPGAVQVLAP